MRNLGENEKKVRWKFHSRDLQGIIKSQPNSAQMRSRRKKIEVPNFF